jgi:hypothetical protein
MLHADLIISKEVAQASARAALGDAPMDEIDAALSDGGFARFEMSGKDR